MELSWLKPVVDAPTVASVHLDVTRTTLDADRGLALRWAHLERQLTTRGCPAEVVASLAERVGEPTGIGGEQSRHLLATPGAVLVDLAIPGRPRADVADWGPVPLLLPLVRALDPMVDYVLVEVDHVGADIHVVGRLADEVAHEEVEGGHDVLHKVRGGGWEHRRRQQRAEDSFQRNADAVLAELDRVVERYDPRLVLLTGDPYSRGHVEDRAPTAVRSRLVTLTAGGRADGVDREALAAAVRAALDGARQADRAAALDRFETSRGQELPTAEGWGAVANAARAGAIDTLLLVDRPAGQDPADAPALWVAVDPLALSQEWDEIAALGVPEPLPATAADAVLRALVAQDASIELLTDGADLRDEVAAVLRFPVTAGPGSTAG